MRAFLSEVHFAVAATIRADGRPHQTVMWYALQDDGTILLNTPFDSLKHRHLKRDPRLSICVEDKYRYLTLQGTAVLNEDPEEAGQDYARLGRRYSQTFGERPSAAPQSRPAILDRPRVSLIMTIESIVSNRFK
jgi:PPOX class probable F420-dependent enzyme